MLMLAVLFGWLVYFLANLSEEHFKESLERAHCIAVGPRTVFATLSDRNDTFVPLTMRTSHTFRPTYEFDCWVSLEHSMAYEHLIPYPPFLLAIWTFNFVAMLLLVVFGNRVGFY